MGFWRAAFFALLVDELQPADDLRTNGKPLQALATEDT